MFYNVRKQELVSGKSGKAKIERSSHAGAERRTIGPPLETQSGNGRWWTSEVFLKEGRGKGIYTKDSVDNPSKIQEIKPQFRFN